MQENDLCIGDLTISIDPAMPSTNVQEVGNLLLEPRNESPLSLPIVEQERGHGPDPVAT